VKLPRLLVTSYVLPTLLILVAAATLIILEVYRPSQAEPSQSEPRTRWPAACDTQKQRLLNPSRPSEHGGDKRRSLRRDGNPLTVFIADARSPDKPLQGRVLDHSRGGLFLFSIGRKIAQSWDERNDAIR
jgi:hypothetical protein